MSKVFKITKDTKHTIWHRAIYKVEADSMEEAKKKIEREDIDSEHSEWLYDTIEPISLEENYAMATSEHLLAGTGLLETDAKDGYYDVVEYPEELNYEIKK